MLVITLAEYQADYRNIRLPTPPNSTIGRTLTATIRAGDCPTCGFSNGQPGYLRTEYPASHAKFGALVACPDCHDGHLAERLARASQLTGWLAGASFNGYRMHPSNRAALEAARKFAEQPTGWLTLWGGYGAGKTHLLAAVINACVGRRVAAYYYTLPDLLDKLRDSYSDDGFSDLYERLVRAPVLALDELDKVRLSDWAREKVYQLCDARYRDMTTRGTLFAMNLEPDRNDTNLGYLFSRMHDYRGRVVELATGDVRPVSRAA